MKLKSIKNLYKTLFILGLSTMFCLQPITNVNAAEKANHGEGTSVTLEGLTFGEHNGCIFSISGEGKSYCIQRGYPFRSLVSDVDMSMVNGQTLLKWAQSQENFKGWGKWEINGDHTDATYKEGQSTKHIPSSGDSGDGGEKIPGDFASLPIFCFSLFPWGFWHNLKVPIEFCCPLFRNRRVVVSTILF